ncbi:MAG TPA: DM13 domain-containing protein [Ignavibacteriaceae bacterium]|nr:DM13 domain-containing protein [Ignavibacteriaceae bacterium]
MKYVKNYLAFLPFILFGCIDTDFIDDPVVSNGSLKIQLSSGSVFVNDSLKLSAQYLSLSGSPVSGGSVTWFSTNKNIARVSQSGYLNGVQKGQATIIASAENFKSGSILVTVVDDSTAVASVIVTGGSSNLSVGENLQLSAKAYDITGNEKTTVNFIWASNDTSIITVNSAGLVTAISAGSSSITAKTDNVLSSTYQITVSGSLRTGTFEKNPSQDHVVSGDAKLKKNNDGKILLEFASNFASSGGPDVRVYLSNTQSITGNSIEVGSLISTSGAQSYELPASVNLNSYDYVLIHCVPFNITFGWAKFN